MMAISRRIILPMVERLLKQLELHSSKLEIFVHKQNISRYDRKEFKLWKSWETLGKWYHVAIVQTKIPMEHLEKQHPAHTIKGSSLVKILIIVLFLSPLLVHQLKSPVEQSCCWCRLSRFQLTCPPQPSRKYNWRKKWQDLEYSPC